MNFKTKEQLSPEEKAEVEQLIASVNARVDETSKYFTQYVDQCIAAKTVYDFFHRAVGYEPTVAATLTSAVLLAKEYKAT